MDDYSFVKITNEHGEEVKTNMAFAEDLKIVNERDEIKNYIYKKFDSEFNLQEIDFNQLVDTLSSKYTIDQILNGNCDSFIHKNLLCLNSLSESVKGNPDEKGIQEGYTTKAPIEKIKRAFRDGLIVVASIAVVASAHYIGNESKRIERNNNVNSAIASLATGEEYENVDLWDLHFTKKLLDSGEWVTIYDTEGIAKDVIEVCLKEPKLFDLTMSELSYKFPYDTKLLVGNMEEVTKKIALYSSENEELKAIYESVYGKNFLDYLWSLNLFDISKDDELADYNQFSDIVKKYDPNAKKEGYNLDDEDWILIKKVIDEYYKKDYLIKTENNNYNLLQTTVSSNIEYEEGGKTLG